MTVVSRAKVAVKKIVKPKRPTFEPEPVPDTLPCESEPAQNLEPVYTPKAKAKPPIPARFTNGGATAEERERWMKENGYG